MLILLISYCKDLPGDDTTVLLSFLQPYVWYSINVSALSRAANASDESMWSLPATINVTTLQDGIFDPHPGCLFNFG